MSPPPARVCVLGLGYIGLPTAATLASRGVSVLGVDTNPAVVAAIAAGQAHFAEPDLDMLLQAALATGRLRASITPEPADAFIIAVPTPVREDRSADLRHVEAAAAAIAPVLAPGNVVILESTSPVGTTARLARSLAAARPDLRFPPAPGTAPDNGEAVAVEVHVAHCPERVLPGQMVRELIENDRIIGGMTPRCAERAAAVYAPFLRGHCHRTDAATAELAKLAENAFRDVNIAFANELSLVCDALGLDVWQVITLANRHPRVSILRPGAGVGGHCIAVDPWFIHASAPEQARLIRTAREVNDAKPRHVAAQVQAQAARFRAPVIACLGLAFKPDVDDVRGSPAVQIVQDLAAAGAGTILAADPHLAALPPALAGLPGVEFTDMLAAIRGADVVAVLVAHSAFRTIPRAELLRCAVVDPTGLLHEAAAGSAPQRSV